MTTPNDGGPAFPQGHLDGPHVDPSGMSLRDWFAGMAITGIVAKQLSSNISITYAVELAYRYADAMIEQRDNKPAPDGC